ncbi:MAG: ABC transporter permease [Bacteroidetes bacterium]|nr:ABC transporter permease [Bacteroidota bacterium]
MNAEFFIAKRILSGGRQTKQISTPIVRIAVGGIALGLAVMIITIAIVTGFQNEIREKIIGFGAHIQIINYDNNTSQEPAPISRQQDFLPLLKKLPEVKHVQVFALKNGLIKTKTDNEGVLLKGIDSDFDWSFIKKNMKEGDVFKVNDNNLEKKIVISKNIAGRLDKKINDRLLIYFITQKKYNDSAGTIQYEERVKEFFISGIYSTGFDEYDKKMVFVDIAQVQKLSYWDKNQVGGFEVTIKDFNDIDKAGEAVDELVGQNLIAQTIRQVNETIFSWLDLQDVNAMIVIGLMVLVASINMISALLILILERTNMIGILKALGSTNWNIQKVFLYNAAYLIGLGLFWGNVIGLGLCLVQQYFGIITLPEETYYVPVVPINIDIVHVLLLNAGTLITCLVMLLVPSFIVSKITPVKAIRFS